MPTLEYGTLYLPDVNEAPVRKQRRKNGTFAPGHIPQNKGKKWSEYISKRAQKRMMKGWANLDKYRCKVRPDNAGRLGKPVIAIFEDDRWVYYPTIATAGETLNIRKENIRRCCQQNEDKHVNRKTGKVNTDHKYKGIRFYFETDSTWHEKINL